MSGVIADAFTGQPRFELGSTQREALAEAVRKKLDVSRLDLRRADLKGLDLSGADRYRDEGWTVTHVGNVFAFKR